MHISRFVPDLKNEKLRSLHYCLRILLQWKGTGDLPFTFSLLCMERMSWKSSGSGWFRLMKSVWALHCLNNTYRPEHQPGRAFPCTVFRWWWGGTKKFRNSDFWSDLFGWYAFFQKRLFLCSCNHPFLNIFYFSGLIVCLTSSVFFFSMWFE